MTVSRKLLLALREPSLTVTVTVAVPDWLLRGVRVTVRLEPLPPKTMLLLGSSVGLEEAPETSRLAAAVSASPTVNGRAAVEAPWVMVWLAKLEMTGAVFTGGVLVTGTV